MKRPKHKPKNPDLCGDCQNAEPVIYVVDYYEVAHLCDLCADKVRAAYDANRRVNKNLEMRQLASTERRNLRRKDIIDERLTTHRTPRNL